MKGGGTEGEACGEDGDVEVEMGRGCGGFVGGYGDEMRVWVRVADL